MNEFNRTGLAQNWLAPGAAVAAAMLREAEGWARAQGELVSGIEVAWTQWMRRQGEAIEANTQSLQRLYDCRNPADLAQIQQQWVTDAMRRTASDIASFANDALAATRRAGAERFAAATDSRPARGTEPAASNERGPVQQRAAAE
jgi:hypothetical protein